LPYIEHKLSITCSHNKVSSIEEKKDKDGGYMIKIMLNDSTTKFFKGGNAQDEAESFLEKIKTSKWI
jgi:RPA family protein